jgi:hypothetical protein
MARQFVIIRIKRFKGEGNVLIAEVRI